MSKRRLCQLISLGVLHSSWGPELKWFCSPVLSCHSCRLAYFACPIGVFVHYSGFHVFPYLAAGTVLLIGLLLGRLTCGWVCPFGLLQDILHKVPGPKLALPPWTSCLRYLVLALLVFLCPFVLGETTEYSFCKICPASALQVTVPNLILKGASSFGRTTLVKLAVLASVLALAVLTRRGFCRTLCPIGAMLAPLNLVSFWAVAPPQAGCASCARCDTVCPTQSTPSARAIERIATSRAPDCIVCHDCRAVCPADEPAKGGRAGSRDGGPWLNMRPGSAGRRPGEPAEGGRAGS